MLRIASLLALWFVLGTAVQSPAPFSVHTSAFAGRDACLKRCHNYYVVCSQNCDKIKNPLQQARCINKCISNWDCCNDICYGKRKTCP